MPPHERCAAHTLSLIATTDIEVNKFNCLQYKRVKNSAFAKCQALWNLLAKSPKACESVQEVTGKSLPSPCPTRWNSTYDCILALLAIEEDKLNQAMRAVKLAIFKDSDLMFLKEFAQCMRPIAEGIDNVQGNTLYGILIPELFRIKNKLKELELSDLKFCGELVKKLSSNLTRRFEKYFSYSCPDAILASISHPFFKLRWVPKNDRDRLKNMFLCNLRQTTLKTPKKNEPTGDLKKYYQYDDDSDGDVSGEGAEIDIEGLQYLKDKDQETVAVKKFPAVYQMFIKYNTVIPSSAPVERLFSAGGIILRPHRRKMSDRLFEALVLMKANGHIAYI